MKSTMTSASALALFLLLFSGTPLASSNLVSLPYVGTPYDYSATLSGSDTCALISIVMDESGTMRLEQEFMFNRAMPDLVDRLKLTFDHIFVCSHGFGATSGHGIPGHFHGCNDGTSWDDPPNDTDLSIMTSWANLGSIEDSFLAMDQAIKDIPATIDGTDIATSCRSLMKNMILVTDEDRDIYNNSSITQTDVKTALETYDYTLNIIANLDISKPEEWKAMGLRGDSSSTTVYFEDGSGGYTTEIINEDPNNFIESGGAAANSDIDYPPLVIGTDGALWDLGMLRLDDDDTIDSFVSAFVDIKVREIELSDITFPPTTVNANGQGEPNSGTNGDPHFKTWKKEHFEYHGQCDMVLAKDPNFANGLGLDVQIRTKLVRFWSYIQNAVIRIGNDILEIQGSGEAFDPETHYWFNYEYQGEVTHLGGFPVTVKASKVINHKRTFEIDLSSVYPNQRIIVKTFKEFIGVDFENASEEAFGKTVGMLGDFHTGKTLARDGTTVLDDFTELGNEWQVLPAEPKLFHEASRPQFPEKCIEPDDPRGERRRRLGEGSVTEEQAEAACAPLKEPADRKDCVYDILATQDIEMVGAY